MRSINRLLISVIILFGFTFVGCKKQPKPSMVETHIVDVTPSQGNTILEKEKNNLVVLDVRPAEMFAADHLPHATNLDFCELDFKDQLENLDKNKTYFVYCQIGKRSRQTVDMMKTMGFKKIYHLKDGFIQWQEQGMPAVSSSPYASVLKKN